LKPGGTKNGRHLTVAAVLGKCWEEARGADQKNWCPHKMGKGTVLRSHHPGREFC